MKRLTPWLLVAVLFGVLPSFVPLASATVNEQTARNASVGDGTTTAFSYTFKILTKNDIEVLVDGVVKTVDTDYTVTGMGVSGGGTVTFTTAPASAAKVTLLRKQAAAQSSDYIAGQSFPAEGVERDLDKLAMQVQQDRETLARTLRARKHESLDMQLPAVASRASKVLGFDSTGLPTAVDLTAGASGGDVSLSTAIASGAVTSRSMASRFGDWVNVKDYGAVGNGVTSDQTAVAAAVLAAYTAGHDMYWPDGTYLTTATIPNFHNVRHRGPGAVLRGSDTFYVEPRDGQENRLYVATTGDDANDGLTASQPIQTVQTAGNHLYGYPYGDVTWKINIAAGTYAASTTFSKPFPTPNRVQFLGAAVADGVVPTTIFDSPGGAGQSGLYFQNGMKAYVEDIKFTDYRDGGSVSISGAGSGITIYTGADVWTRNVHASACDIAIEAQGLATLRVQAGILSSNGIGVKALGNTFITVGYNGSAADITGATGPAVLSNTIGYLGQESANGHIDYTYIGSNTTGMLITERSRIHLMGSSVISNTLGVDLEVLSALYNNPTTTNTFTSNTNTIRSRSGSVLSGVVEESDSFSPGFLEIDTAGGTTQSTSPVTVYTKNFAANELAIRNAGFKLRIQADIIGTAGTKNVTVTLGATTLLNRTVTASSTDYYIEIDFYNRTASGSPVQKYVTKVYENGVAPVVTVASSAEDLTAAKTLTITHNVANAADRNDIELVELQVIH